MKPNVLLLSLAMAVSISIAIGQTRTWNCAKSTGFDTANGNSIAARINAGSVQFKDINNNNQGFFMAPKPLTASSVKRGLIFSAALWGSATESGDTLRTLAFGEMYGNNGTINWWPGPIMNGDSTSASLCSVWDRVFKVTKPDIDRFKSLFANGQITSVSMVPRPIAIWPAKGNNLIGQLIAGFPSITTHQAPFTDVDNDGIYNPLNGDYPDIKGVMALYTVQNTIGNKSYISPGINNSPLPLEAQYLFYQFNNPGVLDSTLFLKIKLVNPTNKTYTNFSLGQWADFDIGNPNDDYIGSDFGRNAIFGYNGGNYDAGFNGYGSILPYCAIRVLQGPTVDTTDNNDNNRNGITDEPNETILPNVAVYFNDIRSLQNGFPTKLSDFRNYLSGKWKNGQRISYDGFAGISVCNGLNCGFPVFMYPGTSMQGSNCPLPGGNCPQWTETTAGNVPGDRRMLISMSGFRFKPNSSKELLLAYNYGMAGNAENSLLRMKVALDSLDYYYSTNFLTGIKASTIENLGVIPFPNPISVQMPLFLKGLESDSYYLLYNPQGKLLVQGKYNTDLGINTTNLTPGMYAIKWINGKKSGANTFVVH